MSKSTIPETWRYVPLEEVCDVNPRQIGPDDPATEVSFIPMPAVSDVDGIILSHESRPYSKVAKGFTRFRDGDVIFAKITPCMENGKIALARELTSGIGCGSTEFHVLRARSPLLPAYLWRFLRQERFRQEAQQQMTGAVGQRRVPPEFLKKAPIPLPPLAKQQDIVAKLDSIFSRTKDISLALSNVPKLIERYRQKILEAAYRGDLTAEWRAKNGVMEPISTTVDTLLAAPIRNGLSVRGTDNPPGVRALRLSALHGGIVKLEDVRFLPITSSRAEKFLLRNGDILVSRGNGTKTLVGISALVQELREPTIFPDTAFRIRLAPDRARPEWFSSMWNAPQVRLQIESAARTTAGIWKISQGDLTRVTITLPAPEEQKEIARRLKSAFSCIDLIAAEALRAEQLIDRLNQAALSAAFRGELVP